MFETELNFFIEHQKELLAKHKGQVLILRGTEVAGAFDTALDAYNNALSRFDLGTFMLQPCEDGPSAYTVTLTSHEVLV
jgi:hypothetical protein